MGILKKIIRKNMLLKAARHVLTIFWLGNIWNNRFCQRFSLFGALILQFWRNFVKKIQKFGFPAVSRRSEARFELPASKLVEISRSVEEQIIARFG